MGRQGSPPFGRGKTFFDGNVATLALEATNPSHSELEGKCWTFEDINFAISSTGVDPYRTGRYVHCMCVRNISGGALLPMDLARMTKTGTGYQYTGQVDATLPGGAFDLAYPVDEFLPAGGVANNDLFWVVVSGPATVRTDTAGTTTINVGDMVVPGGTTAGRVVDQNTGVGAGAATFNQINGAIGRAITATTGVTQQLLVDVIPRSGGI
jgi:hypothetical protein